MSFRCYTCQDTGRVSERGRFYGDRTIGRVCDCQPREGIDHAAMEKEQRDREYADATVGQFDVWPDPDDEKD